MKHIKLTKPIIAGISIAVVLAIVGTVGALNGWFGGGGKIPGDTFTRGLVGYWSFDEGSGSMAYDASGNENHGELKPSATNRPQWTTGKISGALQFDGLDDYVEATVSQATTTIMFWFDDGAGWKHWTKVEDAYYLNGTVTGTPAVFPVYIVGTTVQIGKHIEDGSFVAGKIDEVRIYNRALSAAEIRYHYNRGGPVGHWKFDEGEGQIAYDSTWNNNDGQLGSTTAADAADPKWVTGKYGSALSFDGVDDYVQATVTQTKTSYSLWVKPTSTGLWEHVAKVSDTYYVNGVRGQTPTAFPIYVDGNTIYIGKIIDATTYFNGLIDDVRIYNYARSPEQILQDYNAGLGIYFK